MTFFLVISVRRLCVDLDYLMCLLWKSAWETGIFRFSNVQGQSCIL